MAILTMAREVFGDHRAGEIFYDNLRGLLKQQDSAHLADVLEVHQLCLLLGFRGRYGSEDPKLQALQATLRDRIRRIRGPLGDFSGLWVPPTDEEIPLLRDPVARRLALAAAGLLVMGAFLLLLFGIMLNSGVDSVREMAGLG